jgi:hypothetical protein
MRAIERALLRLLFVWAVTGGALASRWLAVEVVFAEGSSGTDETVPMQPSQWILKQTGPSTDALSEGSDDSEVFVRLRHEGRWVEGRWWAHNDEYVLLLGEDGQIRLLTVEGITEEEPLHRPFRPLTATQLLLGLREELGSGMAWLRTSHQLVGSSGEPEVVRSLAELLSRHYLYYRDFMSRRGLPYVEPRFPLVVVILDDREEFASYARREGKEKASEDFMGYYSLETNRVVVLLSKARGRGEWTNVTTLLHEATHQLCYNTGLFQRYAHLPKWLVEGLAMYFEAPEVSEGQELTWERAGAPNAVRWERFQRFRQRRSVDSIRELVLSDDRFRSPTEMLDAYAESWALTHFLAQKRPVQFQRYLQILSRRQPLQEYRPLERLEDFRRAFGDDFALLDRQLLQHVNSWHRPATLTSP